MASAGKVSGKRAQPGEVLRTKKRKVAKEKVVPDQAQSDSEVTVTAQGGPDQARLDRGERRSLLC